MCPRDSERGAVLLLDAHTTQALACARSLGRSGRRLLSVSARRWPLAAWSKWTIDHLQTGKDTLDEFRRVRAWAIARQASVVLPMTERSCVLCNADREEWEKQGIIVGCAPELALEEAFDKARTLEAARRCGIATPPTWLGNSEEDFEKAARQAGYPCVIKSRFSDARVGQEFIRGGGATYVGSPNELMTAVYAHRQGPLWPMLQGYVEGRGKGVSGLCDKGRAITLFAHERLRDVRPTGSGSSLRRSIPLDPRLREPVERLLEEMNWHGPVMVEFRDAGIGPPCLMEVNGRFWGSVQLAVLSGIDVPALWVQMLEGMPVHPPQTYRLGLTLRWLWGDVKRLYNIAQGPPAGFPGEFPGFWRGLREILGRQPARTRVETWDASDPWPAAAEWLQGIAELWNHVVVRRIRGPAPKALELDAREVHPL